MTRWRRAVLVVTILSRLENSETAVNEDHPRQPAAPVRRLHENLVYRNQFAAIYDDPVAFPDGSPGTFLRIVESDGKPGVAMLALCGGQIALVRTYRYALRLWEWSVPRGFAHGDDADGSAQAELEEELGERPNELISIGTVTPNSSLLASEVKLYLALYSTTPSAPADRKEVAEVKWIDLKTLYAQIVSGHIKDAFTLSALTCAQARRYLALEDMI